MTVIMTVLRGEDDLDGSPSVEIVVERGPKFAANVAEDGQTDRVQP